MKTAPMTHTTLRTATAEEVRARGAGLIIEAGFARSPFGDCLIAKCRHGFCHLGFVGEKNTGQALADMHACWPLAELERDDVLADAWSGAIFSSWDAKSREFPLYVAATPFQAAIWRALLQVPSGALISYTALAAAAGHPRASRATGNAVGANPLAWLIPCHRVVRADGQTGNFRWGSDRKHAMLAWEADLHA